MCDQFCKGVQVDDSYWCFENEPRTRMERGHCIDTQEDVLMEGGGNNLLSCWINH